MNTIANTTNTSTATEATQPKVRCAIYTRVAADALEGAQHSKFSYAGQHERCIEYIDLRKPEGWYGLPDCYDDVGCSGGDTNRPALQRLLADVKAGKVDLVIVSELNRLSRSIADCLALCEILKEHKVGFVSLCSEKFDLDAQIVAFKLMLAKAALANAAADANPDQSLRI